MNSDILNIIGFAAAVLTTSSFIPQVLEIARDKKTKEISSLMYIFMSLGFVLWIVYGFSIFSLPLIIANSISLTFALIILFFKHLYK